MQRKKQSDADNVSFERSSGNVFAVLGLENADELLVKADLATAIDAEIRKQRWNQAEAAERTGLTQAEVFRLGSIDTDGVSQEQMQTVLRRLGVT